MEDWRLTNQEKYMLCICLKKNNTKRIFAI